MDESWGSRHTSLHAKISRLTPPKPNRDYSHKKWTNLKGAGQGRMHYVNFAIIARSAAMQGYKPEDLENNRQRGIPAHHHLC